MSERYMQLQDWVANALHLQTLRLEPISVDASFRRYFRISVGARSYILMDAPPHRRIAGHSCVSPAC